LINAVHRIEVDASIAKYQLSDPSTLGWVREPSTNPIN
jgi:hypothetical protein